MEILSGHIPLYFQFYLKIKNDIVLREIPAGSRIETIEELHTRYGVSHSTVRKAMELLEREGLIVRKRALGTFVRKDVDLPPIFRTTWIFYGEDARPLFCSESVASVNVISSEIDIRWIGKEATEWEDKRLSSPSR